MNREDDSSSKCRPDLRRRIEMRRMTPASGVAPAIRYGSNGTKREADVTELLTAEKRSRTAETDPTAVGSSSSSSGGGEGGSEVPAAAESSPAAPVPVSVPPVAFGSVALSGLSREMEDAVSVRPAFFRPAGGQPLHFFAVFDGHGGSHPDRPDELARIEAAGGRVTYSKGARVDGILAMSRAIGDKYLKAVVISEPEICIMERHPDQDECLIIASDGLWDVMPNDLACVVARRCLMEGNPAREVISSGSESRCSLAANLLARLALGRRSADNVSVIVIDLRS